MSAGMLHSLIAGLSHNHPQRQRAMRNVTMKDNLAYTEDGVPVKTLYIGNIRMNLSEDRIRSYFEEFGTVESFKIHERVDHKFGFVTFASYEDAAKVLKKKAHPVGKCNLRIRSADSWHQPKAVKKPDEHDNQMSDQVAGASGGSGGSSNDLEELPSSSGDAVDGDEFATNGVSLLCLNDDCILHILSFLDIVHLVRLRGTCSRIDELIDITCAKNKESFDFSEINQGEKGITLMTARDILAYLGPQLKSLKIDSDDFNSGSVRPLDLITKYCTSLESLDLDGFNLSKNIVKKLIPVVKNLKKFAAGAKSRFDDSISQCLCKATKLKHLIVCGNWDVTGKFLTKINNLERLSLNRCGNIQPKLFIQALQKNLTLKALEIQCCDKIDDRVLSTIVSDLKQLEELTISNQYPAMKRYDRFGEIASLKKLTVEFHSYTSIDRLLEVLSEKSNLMEFNYVVSDSKINPKTIELIAKLSSLKVLSLGFISTLSDNDIRHLSNLTNLESLLIPGSGDVTPTALLDLINVCTKLNYLEVSETRLNSDFLYKLIDLLKQSKSQRPLLELLVYGTLIDKEILKDTKIVQNSHLIKLNFERHSERRSNFMMGIDEDDMDSDDDFWDLGLDEDDYDYDYDGDDVFDFDINEQWGYYDSDDDKYMYGWGNINTPSPPDW